MFSMLDEKDVDLCIPSFCGWWSDGGTISKRINRFKGIVSDELIKKALEHHPAINTGILSFKSSDKWIQFVEEWTDIAHRGSLKRVFIPDEVACQILYPSMDKFGLKYHIASSKFNVSIKFGFNDEDKRIIHAHGQKHCRDYPLCSVWKNEFHQMLENNVANINSFLQYPDKYLKRYMKEDNISVLNGKSVVICSNVNNTDTELEIQEDVVPEVIADSTLNETLDKDVTIVTACDKKYVEILRETFPNWRHYKKIDKYRVIVFVSELDLDDPALDFLRLPNVSLIPWVMPNAESHREEMLSAFVFGSCDHVKTPYWLKLDADSYATDDRDFITDEMKKYAFCGHKWSYSRPDHIAKLDEWAKGHWKPKLRRAKPMMEEGTVRGRRFYHKTRRTISYIQLHKTKFTRFCVRLLKERKLPAPTQDTFMFFVANRFDPHTVGVMNFKRNYGFTQGNGRHGVESIKARLPKE